MIQEPSFPNYYTKVSALYDGLREMQSQVFERQISSHFNNLAVMGIQLAEESDHIIASYLKENALDFEQLNGSEIRLSSLQEALFDTLEHKLLEADCTGAFILLNAQVNPSVENASVSRSGLYLQRSSLDSSDNRILLYRGLAAIGKKQGCMPHRKWRLEFRTDHVPDFEHIKEKADLPLFPAINLQICSLCLELQNVLCSLHCLSPALMELASFAFPFCHCQLLPLFLPPLPDPGIPEHPTHLPEGI